MNIAVVGANGKSGSAFVAAALKAGHSVRAGVHKTNHFKPHPQLEVVTCDALDAHDVEHLINGCDVVVSLIGHVKGSPAYVQTSAISNVLSAMDHFKISRIVSLTGTGARMSGDMPSVLDRVLNFAILLVDPKRIRDGIAHLSVLKKSNFDWTVIRVLKLTNGRGSSYVLSETGPAQLFSTRASVAQAILKVLSDDSYSKTAPILGHSR